MRKDWDREELPRIRAVVVPGLRGQDRNDDLRIAGDFFKLYASIYKRRSHASEFLVARDLHKERTRADLTELPHTRVLLKQRLIGVVNPSRSFGGFVPICCVCRLFDQPTIESLDCIVDGKEDLALKFPEWVRTPEVRLAPQTLYLAREVEFVKRTDMNEVGILACDSVRIKIFLNRLA
jgi:hypothetical protein